MQVKIRDYNINYEVIGEGKPIIMLHGWLTDLESMRPLTSNLSKKFVSVKGMKYVYLYA